MAVGLAGAGGGRGWTFVMGAVEARLNGGTAGGGGGRGGVWLPAAALLALEVPTRDGDDSDAESWCDNLGGLVVEKCAAVGCGCACDVLGWTAEDEQADGEG